MSVSRYIEYKTLLECVFGSRIVDALVESETDTALRLKSHEDIENFIVRFERKDSEGCQNCKGLEPFATKPFAERKMDFPS